MSIPSYLREIVDDAAIFPPGDLPLPEAVAAHHEHRASPYAGLVGGFVVDDQRLPALGELVSAQEPIEVDLVVTGGAGAIAPAVTWARRTAGVTLRGLEVRLRDEDDLAHNARRVLAALDDAEVDCPVHVEPPRVVGTPGAGWLAALDELAARELALKLRCGGTAEVPTSAELAASIAAALDRELPFKCTAGLHHAVRHDAGHGFLNVLVATRVELDGGDTVAALEERSGEALLAAVSEDVLERTRRWFTSFGSCSVLEPHQDLVALGVLS